MHIMKYIKIRYTMFVSLLLCVIYAGLCYSSDEKAEAPDWLKRVDLGIDAGTNQKPRIYFETVQPLYQDSDKQNTYFIQPRYSLESGDSAYNLGLGYRRLSHDNSVLIGANSFYDYEADDHHYRIGFGLEAFINQVEFRANSYIGLSDERLVNEEGSLEIYEKAVDGLDGEFGIPLPYMNWIKVYGGGYWYNYEKFKDKEGWRLRGELKPFKHTTINLITYDDNKGDAEFRVDARVTVPFETLYGKAKEEFCNIGFSKEGYPEKVDHSNRTLDRVERQHKIEVEKWSKGNTIIEIRRGDT